jgi:hypothetical protein
LKKNLPTIRSLPAMKTWNGPVKELAEKLSKVAFEEA